MPWFPLIGVTALFLWTVDEPPQPVLLSHRAIRALHAMATPTSVPVSLAKGPVYRINMQVEWLTFQ